jgi:hypothetical protein
MVGPSITLPFFPAGRVCGTILGQTLFNRFQSSLLLSIWPFELKSLTRDFSVLRMKMIYPSRLLLFITILSLFTCYTSAAPTSFAEVEESWQRGLSEVYLFLSFPSFPSFILAFLPSLSRMTLPSVPSTLTLYFKERYPQRSNPTPYTILSLSPPSTFRT